MKEWQSEKVKIIVPTLWHYEVLSGLRKAISMKILTREKVGIVLDELHEMGFIEFPPSPESDAFVIDLAGRIGQMVAYDSVYLHLAECQRAEFWTADNKLVEVAKKAGLTWVHSITENMG